eukprot:6491484-Prymnesium_polylepis.1
MDVPMCDRLIMRLLSLGVPRCAAASAELRCCSSSRSSSGCCPPSAASLMFIHQHSSFGRNVQTFLKEQQGELISISGARRRTGRRQGATSTRSRLRRARQRATSS